jgi:hypothetical protein
MQTFQESLTAWATLLGALISFIGLIQSRTWLAGVGTLCLMAAIGAGAYAQRERRLVMSASVRIDGASIDPLNIANLRRRTNSSLVVQEAHHNATIEGEDLTFTWRYSGYCKADRETVLEFSIDSGNNTPFSQLDCFAYDLNHDPAMQYKIRPFLVGADGLSKKIAVPFLNPLGADEGFTVFLKCRLPGCVTRPLGYYISTLSFAQDRVRRCTVRLHFKGDHPQWVRVYECGISGTAELLKELVPSSQDQPYADYLDIAEDVSGRSARVYVFRRSLRVSSENGVQPVDR